MIVDFSKFAGKTLILYNDAPAAFPARVPGYDYYTGRGGVVSPNDPIETIHEVATAYRVEWLIIERANSVPALGPVFSGENRPAWIGPRLVAIPGPDGQTAVAIYPICASTTDRRCTITAVGSRP